MKLFCTLVVVLMTAKCLLAQTGNFDPSFGDEGVVVKKLPLISSQPSASCIAPDGKIILAIKHCLETNDSVYLIRVMPGGSVDSSFGDNGRVGVPTEFYEFIGAVVVDSSLRITALITHYGVTDLNFSSSLIRLNADGSVDQSFADNGMLFLSLIRGYDMLLEEDGKIVIAGNYYFENGVLKRITASGDDDLTFNQGSSIMFSESSATFYDLSRDAEGRYVASGEIFYHVLIVARFKEGVGLDTDFNVTGEVTYYYIIGYGSYDQRCAVQPDGKIIAMARIQEPSAASCVAWRFNEDGSKDITFGDDGMLKVYAAYYLRLGNVLSLEDTTLLFSLTYFDGFATLPVMIKFKEDGTPDDSFGNNGKSIAPFSTIESVMPLCCELLNEDSIILWGAGWTGLNLISNLSKFSPAGLLDTTFGNNGLSYFPAESVNFIWNLFQFQPLNDGKILAQGSLFLSPATTKIPLIRFLSNGDVDSSYGTDGMLALSGYSYLEENVMAKSVNHVYLAKAEGAQTSYFAPYDADSIFLSVFRLNPDGMPDSTFGINGRANPKFPGRVIYNVEDILIDADERMLMTGELYTDDFPQKDGFVLRLNADGTPDTTFGVQGILIYDLDKYDQFQDIAIQDNSKILVAAIDSSLNLVLYRLEPDGSADPLFGINGSATYQMDTAIEKIKMTVLADNRIAFFLEAYFFATPYTFMMLQPDGTMDDSFSDDGITYFGFSKNDRVTDILQVNDGNMVFAGTGSFPNGTSWNLDKIIFGKIKTDGSLDETFGDNGIIIYENTGFEDALDLEFQEDGKILLSGNADHTSLMIRLLNDSSIATEALPLKRDISISVYPNPTSGDVAVISRNNDPVYHVIITDIQGHTLKIYEYDDFSSIRNFSVSNFAPGAYFLSVVARSGILRQKIIKM